VLFVREIGQIIGLKVIFIENGVETDSAIICGDALISL
jgi:hypothetical protein